MDDVEASSLLRVCVCVCVSRDIFYFILFFVSEEAEKTTSLKVFLLKLDELKVIH